jgi:hypothetical protein
MKYALLALMFGLAMGCEKPVTIEQHVISCGCKDHAHKCVCDAGKCACPDCPEHKDVKPCPTCKIVIP